MNKNIIWISLIILVPIAAYWGLTRNDNSAITASASPNGDTIIKFSSPLCAECQELEKVFESVFPKYENKVCLQKIDVTRRNKNSNALIEKYEVKLVPTTVLKNQDGKIVKRFEGTVQPQELDTYITELINE